MTPTTSANWSVDSIGLDAASAPRGSVAMAATATADAASLSAVARCSGSDSRLTRGAKDAMAPQRMCTTQSTRRRARKHGSAAAVHVCRACFGVYVGLQSCSVGRRLRRFFFACFSFLVFLVVVFLSFFVFRLLC
jgi:hypothetical protein